MAGNPLNMFCCMKPLMPGPDLNVLVFSGIAHPPPKYRKTKLISAEPNFENYKMALNVQNMLGLLRKHYQNNLLNSKIRVKIIFKLQNKVGEGFFGNDFCADGKCILSSESHTNMLETHHQACSNGHKLCK